ncbi:MAG TPA: nucleoside hydrolase, partial [Tahibacter sp.]|nr:nucleoside hydrolase [Tahibacter sp.]
MNQKLLIDTDPGVDDALALLMAYRHSRVAALSIAAGNVGLAHTVANALKLTELVGVDTPVH